MKETQRSNRYHIGIFGKRNVGKSTLLNALTGQDVSIVSDVAGTTTDTVWKNIELPTGQCPAPMPPAVFVSKVRLTQHLPLKGKAPA